MVHPFIMKELLHILEIAFWINSKCLIFSSMLDDFHFIKIEKLIE